MACAASPRAKSPSVGSWSFLPEAAPSELPVEAAPAGAASLFGDRFPLAERYVALLCAQGTDWGLLGPREATRIWSRHVAHCALLAAHLPQGASVIDVGSGAGLPGLPLAIARPDLQVTLLEPLERRTRFLDLAISTLSLNSVWVLRARADDAPRAQWSACTSRAVAAMDKLARWSLPLLTPGGSLWAIRGLSAVDELASCGPAVRKAGAVSAEIRTLTGPAGSPLEPLTVLHATVSRETGTRR